MGEPSSRSLGRSASFTRMMAAKDLQSAPACTIAIDFGTRGTGFAVGFKGSDDIEVREPGGHEPRKALTAVLLEPDGRLVSFGTSALKAAKEDEHGILLFFENYKMELSDVDAPSPDSMLVRFDKLLLSSPRGAGGRGCQVKAANGRELPLLHVIATTLRYVKEQALAHASRSLPEALRAADVQWVVTVPAIWRDQSKGFMRKAACEAGLIDNEASPRLLIALEPECAAIAADVHNLVQEGDAFVVIDAGGGTVDITVHRRARGGGALCLHELVAPCGGPWGSTVVDSYFDAFIGELVGDREAYAAFKKTPLWVELMDDWESTKLAYEPGEEAHIKLGNTLLSGDTDIDAIDDFNLRERVSAFNASEDQALRTRGKTTLVLPPELVESFFEPALEPIADQVAEVLSEHRIKQAFLVGGFAESKLLQILAQQVVSKSIPAGAKASPTLTIPVRPGLAVLRGAVMFGEHPEIFASRKARVTYGYGTCVPYDKSNPIHQLPEARKELVEQSDGSKNEMINDHFSRLVKVGDDLPTGHTAQSSGLSCLYVHQTSVRVNIYTTEKPTANFTTDSGVRRIGSVSVACQSDKNESINFKLEFGATEIIALAKNVNTGATERVNVAYDF